MEKTIYKKLLEVQKEIGAIKKDSTNPFFKSKYFDINSLLAGVKPVLNKHGLVLLQGIDYQVCGSTNEMRTVLTTKIVDSESGEEVESQSPLTEAIDAQKAGSAITYFRRYALQSLLALEAEDDDGETTIERGEVDTKIKITGVDKPTKAFKI